MRKKLGLLSVFMVVFMLVGLLAGCGGSSSGGNSGPQVNVDSPNYSASGGDTTGGGGDAGGVTIAYVSALLTNEIFAMQVRAMQAYCEEIGVTLLNTPCDTDPQRIAAIENYTEMGVDVIICHVSTPEAIEDAMKRAQDAGIKFFSYDTPTPGDDAFFGWDNYDYGQAIGANAANWVNANFADGEVCNVFTLGYPTVDFCVVRESGYVDALAELCGDKVNFVNFATGGSTANGVTAAENWLQMGVDINLVIGINDAGVLGAYEAFNAAGLGGDKVACFAGDATVDAINAMQQPDSIYRGTVLTGLEGYASKFIDIAINLANGVEEYYYFGGLWFITPENVGAYAASGAASDLDMYADYYTKTISEYWSS